MLALGNNGMGRSKDGSGGPVVLLEVDRLGSGKVYDHGQRLEFAEQG